MRLNSRILFRVLIVLLFHFNSNAQQKAVNAFYYASELVIDSKGNLFVSGKNNKIIKITPDGTAWHFAGHPNGSTRHKDGKETEAMFIGVKGLTIDDDDNIYVADYNIIRKVTPDKVVTTIFGNPNKNTVNDGDKDNASFYRLGAITIDKKGTVYVVDEVFDSQQKRTFNIIRKISPSGHVTTIKNPDGTIYRSHYIQGLICDKEDNLFVAKVAWSSCINKITPDGAITTIAGVYDENQKNRSYFKEGDIRTARVISPTRFAFNQNGELIFSDYWIGRILKIANNQVTIIAGGGGKSANGANFMGGSGGGSSVDGKGKQASFNSPTGIAYDKNGNLFIVDVSSNSCVRKLSPDGMVATFCKQAYNPVAKRYEDYQPAAAATVKNPEIKSEKSATTRQLDSIMSEVNKIALDKMKKFSQDSLRLSKEFPDFTNPMFSFIKKPKADTVLNYKMPPRNEKWLRALPDKILTAAELKTHIDAIEKKYTYFLLSSGIKLPDVSALTALDVSYSSSMALLEGLNNEAAWLAMKAIQKSPGNILVLNNSGAVLNACGFQPIAAPVLETALEKNPGNSNIENNLGQAYVALGDMQKATQHLQKSISSNPYHPHANLSLAYIHVARGDKSNAIKYVENSVRGSFNDGAMHLLFKLNPDARLIKYLKDRYKPPDYFNEDKYHLPRQCEKVSEIAELKGEYAAFRKMVTTVKKKFEAVAKEENKLAAESIRERTQHYKKSGIMQTPFTQLGTFMIWDRVYMRIHDENEKLAKAQQVYKKTIAELQTAYKDARDKAEDCGTETELSNRYMELMAFATREYQKYWMPFWTEVFNDMVFWCSVAYPDKHFQRANHAAAISGFLGEVLRMAETHFLEPGGSDCADTKEKQKNAEEYSIPDPYCPIDINLDYVIGSFSLNCEKIEYHFGGGITLVAADAVHSFRNHKTTIAIGAGLDVKFGGEKLKAGPIKGGFEAKGKMQYYLTFDGTHPSDQGFIWETGVKYSQKIKTGIEVETVFSDIKKKVEGIKTTDIDLSANTVLSVHNGWTFDGSLYENLDKILEPKQEKPGNKNIKIYNQ